MITQYKVIAGKSYLLRATAATTVSCMVGNESRVIATASEEEDGYFSASSNVVEVDTGGEFIIQELFNPAPLALAGGGGGSPAQAGQKLITYTGALDGSPIVLADNTMTDFGKITTADFSGLTTELKDGYLVTCEFEFWSGAEAPQPVFKEGQLWLQSDGSVSNNIDAAPVVNQPNTLYAFTARIVNGQLVLNLQYQLSL